MFVHYAQDELHEQIIMDYLHTLNLTQSDFNELLATYKQLIIEIPAILMSINLDNPIERNKFLIPDSFMIGLQKDGPGAWE
jgi:hypothetical protein